MSDVLQADRSFQPPLALLEAWDRHPIIVKIGDPVLRQVAKPVLKVLAPETKHLIDRMIAAMRDAHGLGLAAPQVGVPLRIIVYDVEDALRVVINPVILSRRGEQLDPPEGCLSIPGLRGQVKRDFELRVRGLDHRGRPFTRRVSGMEARVIQHEVDHLDGILFIDRAEPETLTWASEVDEEDEEEESLRE